MSQLYESVSRWWLPAILERGIVASVALLAMDGSMAACSAEKNPSVQQSDSCSIIEAGGQDLQVLPHLSKVDVSWATSTDPMPPLHVSESFDYR